MAVNRINKSYLIGLKVKLFRLNQLRNAEEFSILVRKLSCDVKAVAGSCKIEDYAFCLLA